MIPTIFLVVTIWHADVTKLNSHGQSLSKSYTVMRTMDECRWNAPAVLDDASTTSPPWYNVTVECKALMPGAPR